LDLIQLYSASQRVIKSLETTGLMPALRLYRASLRNQRSADDQGREAVETRLITAAEEYIEKTTMFGDDEKSIVNLLHLGQLGTSSFWIDLTSVARPVNARQALYDSIESAASPDRASRLIDAVDMLYGASASLADVPADTLQLMSVSGVAVRTLIFHGDVDAVTATQRIIEYLNSEAAKLHADDGYSVESIAASMPFLGALNDLEAIEAVGREDAEIIHRQAEEGAIMLLETGAQLVEGDEGVGYGFIPASVVAKLDADARSFDQIDSSIRDSIDEHYNSHYDRERSRLINEGVHTRNVSVQPTATRSRGDRGAGNATTVQPALAGSAQGIDELIGDLNRLYGDRR